MSQQSFADLGVSNAVARALSARGIERPFPIQQLVIADVLAGRDVLAKSPTGSGKTLAFGVPIVDRIAPDAPRPAALVLAPTRELANQIVDETRAVARARNLTVTSVYGGVGFEKQTREARRSHIVVATPGRLEDLLARGALTLDQRPHARARRGRPDARHGLPPGRRPDRRAVPAAAPDAVLLGHARRRGRPHRQGLHARRRAPRAHAAGAARRPTSSTASWRSSATTSCARWSTQLNADDRELTLVFVRTKRGADRLVRRLSGAGVEAVAMHGDKSQRQREKALASLRGRPRRHARRHRRRRARHRRRRHLARHQLRPAGRP